MQQGWMATFGGSKVIQASSDSPIGDGLQVGFPYHIHGFPISEIMIYVVSAMDVMMRMK